MSEQRKRRIFDIIQIGQDSDTVSRSFDIAVMLLILTNLVIAILETFDAAAPWQGVMNALELVTVLCFTVEYALRVWTAEYLYPEDRPKRAVLRYVTSFSGLVDLLSFAPYYLPVFFPAGVVAFRMFRVIRILRLFRINAYYDALSVIGDVIRGKRDQLVSSIFIILVLMTASSLCMYSLEHEAQPEVFQNAFSGFWWAVSTLLTVGYGDIYPVTAMGRLFGIMITFLGVGMVAIPTGILSAGFVEQYTRIKSRQNGEGLQPQFLWVTVTDGHPWAGRSAGELALPSALVSALVRRGNRLLPPARCPALEPGDAVLLVAGGAEKDNGISVRSLRLTPEHPWTGQTVEELELSRRTWLAAIHRRGGVILPRGGDTLQEGDLLLLCTRL
jgi:voltage-gated potassium channel